MDAHYWSYCSHCDTKVVICGRCGNNCCNGGYGEELGPEPGELITCRACPSAYEVQTKSIKQELLTKNEKAEFIKD
jgi:hypothetical protein